LESNAVCDLIRGCEKPAVPKTLSLEISGLEKEGRRDLSFGSDRLGRVLVADEAITSSEQLRFENANSSTTRANSAGRKQEPKGYYGR
jgi:hypothetical protein